MHDKYRKRYRTAPASSRLREQIAREAARRMYKTLVPPGRRAPARLARGREPERPLYRQAKSRRRAGPPPAARRPAVGCGSSRATSRAAHASLLATPRAADREPDPEPGEEIGSLAQAIDRFAIYKMRLEPLESVKQNPRHSSRGRRPLSQPPGLSPGARHPPLRRGIPAGGSLARRRPGHRSRETTVAAGIEALRGSVTERTLWLIEHQNDLSPRRDRPGPGREGSPPARDRPISAKVKRAIDESEYAEDLLLLRELDQAGRVPGQPVDTLSEVLDYLKGLEHESYLDD